MTIFSDFCDPWRRVRFSPADPAVTYTPTDSNGNSTGQTINLPLANTAVSGTTAFQASAMSFLRLPPGIERRFRRDLDQTYVIGDFTVCPFSQERPGSMQDVCIAGADHLVAVPRR